MRSVNGSTPSENRGGGHSGGGYSSGGGASANNGSSGAPPGGSAGGLSGGGVIGGGGASMGLGGPGSLGHVPELKHHADFLSRLLAATPSYMSEIGNPPPGFFSDWLRRLVSKPSGNSSSPGIPTSGLTFSGQPETERTAGAQLDAQIPTKRRKRSRLNDHPLGGKDMSDIMNPPGPNANSSTNLSSPVGGSSSSSPASAAAAAAAAAAALHPFGAHPLWFFPPFLPNPYMNSAAAINMNLGMSFPGHHSPSSGPGGGTSVSGSQSVSGLSAAQAAAAASYLGGMSPSDLFRTDNLNLLGSGGVGASSRSGSGSPQQSSGATHAHHHFVPPTIDANHLHHAHPHPSLSHPASCVGTNSKMSANSRDSSLLTNNKDKVMSPSPLNNSNKDSLLMGGGGGGGHVKIEGYPHISSQSQGQSHSHLKHNNHHAHHHSHHNNSLGLNNGKGKSGTKTNSGGSGANGNLGTKSKSSSFSISRLTSPSPSSNSSSTGSCGSNLGNSATSRASSVSHSLSSSITGCVERGEKEEKSLQPHPHHHNHHSNSRTSSASPSTKSSSKLNVESGGAASAGAQADAGLCVDLRVSGRIWESSACAPAPRSIYKPLSAFRDPSDVNLYNSSRSSPQVPHNRAGSSGSSSSGSYDHHHLHHHHQQHHPESPGSIPASGYSPANPNATLAMLSPHLSSQLGQQPKTVPGYTNSKQSSSSSSSSSGSSSASFSLSTKYVLENLQHIYQKMRPNGTNTNNNSSNGSLSLTTSNSTAPVVTISNSNGSNTAIPNSSHSPPPSSNQNQITVSHPINNHHSSTLTTKDHHPLINHHLPLTLPHYTNANNNNKTQPTPKPNRSRSHSPTSRSEDSDSDGREGDNISDHSAHSSDELKIKIKINGSNATIANNNNNNNNNHMMVHRIPPKIDDPNLSLNSKVKVEGRNSEFEWKDANEGRKSLESLSGDEGSKRERETDVPSTPNNPGHRHRLSSIDNEPDCGVAEDGNDGEGEPPGKIRRKQVAGESENKNSLLTRTNHNSVSNHINNNNNSISVNNKRIKVEENDSGSEESDAEDDEGENDSIVNVLSDCEPETL